MTNNRLFAVIIGVDRYTDFDPTGEHNLGGAVHDATAWFHLLTTHFGVPAAHIRLLLAPAGDDPPPAQAPKQPEAHAKATKENIEIALRWLSDRLASPGGSGLVTFAGHGLALRGPTPGPEGMSLGLCPTDIGPRLDRVITIGELQLQLTDRRSKAEGERVLRDTTMIIDACYTKERYLHARSLGVTHVVPVVAKRPHAHVRLMLAAHLWESAYEFTLGCQRRGVFSASLQAMIEQWRVKAHPEGAVHYLDASYADLLFYARSLIQTFNVPQSPALIGEVANLALLPVLWPETPGELPRTSPTPNAQIYGEQLDPDSSGYTVYTISTKISSVVEVIGYVVVIGQVPPAGKGSTHAYDQIFTQTQEYWFFDPEEALSLNESGVQVQVELIRRQTWSSLSNGTDSPSIEAALALPQRLNPMSSLLSSTAYVALAGAGSTGWYGTLTVGQSTLSIGFNLGYVVYSDDGSDAAQIAYVSWLISDASAPTDPLFKNAGENTSTSWMSLQSSPSPGQNESWYQWPPPLS